MEKKENARVQGERGETYSRETEHAKAHEGNLATSISRATPSFHDAEFLVRAGYELIPLRNVGKAPRDKNWVRRPYDSLALIAEARERGGNLGVRLRPTDLVVDVDPRNGGDESLQALVADAGLDLDAWPHVITGGGGHHYYLSKPAGLAIVGKLARYPGIDFKTLGGQVVAPGAVHPETGRRYESEFFLLGPDETPDAPPALLDLLQVRRVTMPDDVDDADRWGEIDAEQLAAALVKLPTDKFGEGSHEDWFQLMCACHHATAGAGREEFIAWSTSAPGYEDHAEQIGYRWDSLASEAGRGGRPTTIRHLYQVLGRYDIPGIPHPAPEGEFDVAAVDGEALPGLRRMKNGKPESTFPNCLKLVRHINSQLGLVYDEFGCGIHLVAPELPWTVDVGRRLDDDVVRRIRQHLVEFTDMNWHKEDVLESLLTLARENPVHPVRDYLTGLTWDGVPRIDRLLVTYARALDNAYVHAIGAKALIAAVRRVRQPGCKFDNVVVLEGDQGCGKSSFVKSLSPNVDWFSDSPIGNTESKDAPLSLQGRWIIELGEMSVLSKSGVEALKAFVSSSIDHVRRPYGRLHEELRRQCIFIGTTNQGTYLKDQTGNRRFWPVKVGTIDLNALVADRDQLWAEAACREASGESLFLPQELWDVATVEQEERVADDPWVDIVCAYLDSTSIWDGHEIKQVEPLDRVHTATLLSGALSIRPGDQTAAHTQRLKVVMEKHLGWKHKPNIRAGEDGKQGRGYQRV
ncbi:MAG: VapE family protein [Thiobacillus sp.]|nr:VapE family protein [Thiobacillus sp.]MDP3125591.1 VapE family protein [Thiobacillus sp.]